MPKLKIIHVSKRGPRDSIHFKKVHAREKLPGAVETQEHPSQTDLKRNCHEIAFARNLLGSYPMVSKLCTVHGSDNVMFFV